MTNQHAPDLGRATGKNVLQQHLQHIILCCVTDCCGVQTGNVKKCMYTINPASFPDTYDTYSLHED